MKIEMALREAHIAERQLATDLLGAGERNKAEHDIYHLTRTLSGWCDAHIQRLVAQGRRLGLDLDERTVREEGAGLAGRSTEPALLLLMDLRGLHLAASRSSLAWTALGQGAQAIADRELLDTVDACHPETIRTLKWSVQRVKDISPQALAS
jgi:hypothetical protein